MSETAEQSQKKNRPLVHKLNFGVFKGFFQSVISAYKNFDICFALYLTTEKDIKDDYAVC